jgi:aminoglycoside phosphotransferase (APT) family kinase protein
VSVRLHADELSIDEDVVGRLVADQLPEYSGASVRRLAASGSSNALFRLGDDLLVRLPRQSGGSATLLKEVRWLRQLRDSLPVAVPEVIAVGDPGHGYSEHWSVVRWIDGEHPAVAGPAAGSRDRLARDLAGVVRALRQLEVPPEARQDATLRSYRAASLTAIDPDIRDCAEQCRAIPGLDLDLDAVLVVWDEAIAIAADSSSPGTHWVHGDLFAENLLVRGGRLTAVLDFGGLAVGDTTVDLVPAWELLDPKERALFRTEVGVDDRTWLLSRAWALAIALMTLPYYWRTMPERSADRLALAQQVLRDAKQG